MNELNIQEICFCLRGNSRLFQRTGNSGETLEPGFYRVFPDFVNDIDLPFSIELSSTVKKTCDLKLINVCYLAGYKIGEV